MIKPYANKHEGFECHVAIQGVCAWPNLTQFHDGTVVATIFNQPCHGQWEADLDCWASIDGGLSWTFRGRPCPHEPGTNRMNCATGLTNSGEMIVLGSGWDNRLAPYQQPQRPLSESRPLRTWVCRSSDQGRCWQRIAQLPEVPDPAMTNLVPFGKVVVAEDGSLRSTAYNRPFANTHEYSHNTFMLRANSDGSNWRVFSKIADRGSEADILPLGGGRWLAVSRSAALDSTAHLTMGKHGSAKAP